MATGDVHIGLKGVFLYGLEGSTATTATKNVDAVDLAIQTTEEEYLERGDDWFSSVAIAHKATLKFEMKLKDGDPLIPLLDAAWASKGRIALYPTSKASGKGLDADYTVLGRNEKQDNQKIIRISYTVKPTSELRKPVFH